MKEAQAYKGTRDFYPLEARKQQWIFNQWSKIAEKFGYEPYNGPMIEEYALYELKSGDEILKEQLYVFEDKSKRKIALRPEMTPTLARMLSKVSKNLVKPIRWYSIPNLYRYEQPQRGRLREHWQLNCDLFGLESPYAEFEIISLLIEIFEWFKLSSKEVQIFFNHRSILEEVFHKIELNSLEKKQLIKLIDKKNKISEKDFTDQQEEISKSPLLKDFLSLKNFHDLLIFLKKENFNCYQQISSLGTVVNSFSSYLFYEPSIVRGLDYYTGFVFEAFSPKLKRALCGGGRYDDLLKIFHGENLSGIGFGFGDVTWTELLTEYNLFPEIFSHQEIYFGYETSLEEAMTWVHELRKFFNVTIHYHEKRDQKVYDQAKKRKLSFFAFLTDQGLNLTNLSSHSKTLISSKKDIHAETLSF